MPVRSASLRALPLLALLVAACEVDVDGAPCAVPGETGDCPGGQACGNDRRCSARALGCAATRCLPDSGGDCLDPTGIGSGTAVARRCVDTDPVCGAWTLDPCADRGQRCVGGAAGARCE
jgi:hypothetical protein